jgi:ATP-dependent helicase/nuclease subunit A
VSPRRPLPDAAARERIRSDLSATLFVEAAAGTGKTTELVARIVALLRTGTATLDRIAAVTFTEKAAGEMKLRVRGEIERARAAPDASEAERRHLDRALEKLEVARIGTIHAFCGDLLHERPVEAGVDPLFQVAPEEESERLLDGAFDAWFQETLADPPEGIRRVLRRRPRGWNALGPRQTLRGAVANLVEHRDFPAPWRRDPAFDRRAAIDRVFSELCAVGALAERAERADDWLAKNLAEIARFTAEVELREAARGARDHDELEAELREIARSRQVHWHWQGSPRRPYGPGLERAAVKQRRDAARQSLKDLCAACDADLAACLHEELRPVVERYERAKERAGVLDFLDLLVKARDLLVRDRGVREKLQRDFSHFFVDEFQDTDPLQAEILLLLAAADPAASDWRRAVPVAGKLFLVGDPKQSIYRFRRAEVGIYEEVKRRLAAAGADVLYLTTSFRGVPAIQQAVNAAFAPRFEEPSSSGEAGVQAAYVPLERFREDVPGRPAVVALPVPRPYGDYGRIVGFRIEDSVPDAVGAFVHWLVAKIGWTVWDPTEGDHGAQVPIAPRHVCLLFRRFKNFRRDVTRDYVRALEARRVPHVLVGGRSFHDREEVLAVRNALAAVEWPEDELRVYATLRGPLFALRDDALLAFPHRLHPLRRFSPEEIEELDKGEPELRQVADALGVLGELHRHRNRRPIARTIAELLRAVRAHAGLAIWPTGEQALANVLRTIDRARRFERQGATSFRAFVEHLEAEAERGEAQDAPVVEEGTEGVRIMTVHRAKGLEFPVVVLADPTCNAWRDTATRHVDPARGLWAEPLCGCAPHDLLDAEAEELARDRAEAVRIAYVAATRARDLLVVPAVGDPWERDPLRDREGWLDLLDPAIRPPHPRQREARPAPGCPDFGTDSVLEWPERVVRRASDSVRPGLHAPEVGAHEVVWWDPSALELDVQERVGLRQQRILAADERGGADDRGVRAHESWQRARREALERAGQPSLRAAAVTALAEAASAETGESEVQVETVPGDPAARAARPGGKRFGTLVHAVLAAVDLAADAAGVEAAARAQGRLVGATPEEVAAATEAVRAALAHPLLRRAAESQAAGGLRRETPVLLRLPDGVLAEGVVDLAFREGQHWTVVDFKTDRELGDQRSAYAAQVRLYARAVAAATGEPAHPVLLVV